MILGMAVPEHWGMRNRHGIMWYTWCRPVVKSAVVHEIVCVANVWSAQNVESRCMIGRSPPHGRRNREHDDVAVDFFYSPSPDLDN